MQNRKYALCITTFTGLLMGAGSLYADGTILSGVNLEELDQQVTQDH